MAELQQLEMEIKSYLANIGQMLDELKKKVLQTINYRRIKYRGLARRLMPKTDMMQLHLWLMKTERRGTGWERA